MVRCFIEGTGNPFALRRGASVLVDLGQDPICVNGQRRVAKSAQSGEVQPQRKLASQAAVQCPLSDITNTVGGAVATMPDRRATCGSSMMKPTRKTSQPCRSTSTSQGPTTASSCGSAASFSGFFEGVDTAEEDKLDEEEVLEDPAMDVDDPQSVAEYAQDIYRNLVHTEVRHAARSDYMTKQPSLNRTMRSWLIDWFVEVHIKYKLKAETLYLTVNLLDRYLEVQAVRHQELQLIGVTVMFIASKFEEIYPPEVKDFVYICNEGWSKEEILDAEVRILTRLQFVLCAPTFGHFLDRYAHVIGCSEDQKHLMQYLLELTLPHSFMLQYPPSHLAAAAVLMSNKLLRHHPSWPAALAQETCHSGSTFEACAKQMCDIFEAASYERSNSESKAIFRKFCGPRYSRVATRAY